jgi:hypothetical protein
VLPFVLSGDTGLSAGRLQNIFGGLPDVPLTSFSLAIDGGPHGLLVATRDLCSGPVSTVDAALTGQNGATVNASAAATVVGCGPAAARKPRASAKLRGLGGSHPLLQLTVLAGTNKLRNVSVTLPKALVVANPKRGVSAIAATFKLSKKSVKLTRKGKLTLKLPSRGATRVTAKLSNGSIKASKRLKRQKHPKLTLTIHTTDVRGHRATLRLKVTGHR